MAPSFELRWRLRPRPLPAVAALARGEAVARLGRRLLADPHARRFEAVAAAGVLWIRGPELPWVEGLVYLACDPVAPLVLLPTQHEPEFPLDLLERAIKQLGERMPCVLLPEGPGFLLSIASSRPLEIERLARFLERPDEEAS